LPVLFLSLFLLGFPYISWLSNAFSPLLCIF
jgi:hypothetical protein